MTDSSETLKHEIERLKRKLNREMRARHEAEHLLEEKSSQLYDTNRRLEIEARRAQSLTAAIESATDGVAITDEAGCFVFMNEAHAVMFDYAVDELIGKPWHILYEDAELKRLERLIFPELGATGYWRGESTGISKTGRYILQEIALTALSDGGLICATRDNTSRRQAQIVAREMEQRLVKAEHEAALFTMGNAVAHDFNNLLGAITGYATLITRTVDEDEAAYGYAMRINAAAEQAANVIRSLEVERTNDTQSVTQIDLVALMNTGLSIAEAIRPPAVALYVEMPDAALVRVNEVSLSRSLLNIVKNAFEAMGDKGSLVISVLRSPRAGFERRRNRITLGEPHAAYDWCVEIQDTGIGLSQDKLERIFDPFYSANTKRKGSGLGLQSLLELVEGGAVFVEVESRIGKGTLFRLNFAPLVPANETNAPFQTPAVLSLEDNAPRILLIEDEVMMGEVLREMLHHLQYSCDLEHSPKAALSRIENPDYQIDLVITDITMPELSGEQVARRIKALRPDLPVIILSGQARFIKPDPRYAAVLTKPVSEDQLDKTISHVLTAD